MKYAIVGLFVAVVIGSVAYTQSLPNHVVIDLTNASSLTVATTSTLTGAVTASSTLAVASDGGFGGNLTVAGTSTQTGAVTMGGTLAVASDGGFGGNLTVTGTSDLKGNLQNSGSSNTGWVYVNDWLQVDGGIVVTTNQCLNMDGTNNCDNGLSWSGSAGAWRVGGASALSFTPGTGLAPINAGYTLQTTQFQPQAHTLSTCASGTKNNLEVDSTGGAGGKYSKLCMCSFDGTTYRWENIKNASAARAGNTTTCPDND